MTPELSAYGTVFAVGFVAATLLPASSEAVLVGFLVAGVGEPGWLVVWASVGNTLGSVVNWICGRFLLRYRDARWFPVPGATLERAGGWFRRFGLVSLLFAWLPVVGDALTVAAGLLRVPFGRFTLLVGMGKALRYATVAAATLAGMGAL